MAQKGRSGQLFERLLQSRLQNHSGSQAIRAVDEATAYLLSTFPEYRRRAKDPTFRSQVAKVVANISSSAKNDTSEEVKKTI